MTEDKLPELKEYQAGYSEDIEGNEYIEIYLGVGNLYKKDDVKAKETALVKKLRQIYVDCNDDKTGSKIFLLIEELTRKNEQG
jgi:hypothetical protein